MYECINGFQFSVLMSVETSGSSHLCVFCDLSWALSLLIVLSYSNVFIFVLSYYIIFYYYPLNVCLFSNERWKGMDLNGRGGREEVGEEGREIIIKKFYREKHLF